MSYPAIVIEVEAERFNIIYLTEPAKPVEPVFTYDRLEHVLEKVKVKALVRKTRSPVAKRMKVCLQCQLPFALRNTSDFRVYCSSACCGLRQQKTGRNKEILAMRKDGVKFKAIAEHFGMRTQRVYHICYVAAQRVRQGLPEVKE